MINKKHIATMARHITRRAKGLKDPRIMHPEREWVIGLVISVGIFAVTAAGSGFSYMKNKHPVADNIEEAAEIAVYRESMVKDALKELVERDRQREALLSGMSFPEIIPSEPVATSSETVASSSDAVATSSAVGE